ncbi:hypothetical protein [Rhizobium leguminosarum]|uniref:hypothetical protein n=1 Tax=Rhizobium leguminosarum TaxID=384 RepID=UPI001C97F784|nr:hypothetical protein [Rhizobium leguminosarum]MBY5416421.1 hypothetical protein [Rhizobium leguminosarum]
MMSSYPDLQTAQQRILDLSEFELIGAAERWVNFAEERVAANDEYSTIGGLRSQDLRAIISDVRQAERSLDRPRSLVVARLILLAALSTSEQRAAVLHLLDAPDDTLKAGVALRFGTVAVALLLLAGLLKGDAGTEPEMNPAYFSESTEAETIVEALSGGAEDNEVWQVLDWLTSILNASQVTALLNAIGLGSAGAAAAKFVLERRKTGAMLLVFPDGKEVEIPPDKQAAVQRLMKRPTKERQK